MPVFNYIARDEEGKTLKGSISADSEAGVVVQLRKKDLFIISIDEQKAVSPAIVKNNPNLASSSPSAPVKANSFMKFSFGEKKITTKDVVVFSRQFSTLLDAKVPIAQALEALGEQTVNPSFRTIILKICEQVKEGNGLSSSFAQYPKIFDTLYVNMLLVGEKGGILDEVLQRTAIYLEKSEGLKQKIKSALTYPVVVVGIAMLITMGLITKVVPTFAHIYDSLGQKLPAMTQVLIDFSDFMSKGLGWIIGGGIIFSVLFTRYRKTPNGSLQLDRMLLNMPIFGDMVCKAAVSRFCQTFATLLQSGVPILEALDIVKNSSGNRVIELLAEKVKVSVREGESFAAPLLKSKVFPPMVSRMISIGEKSGQLDVMMLKVADFYNEELETTMEGLTKIIEPLIIGFLGIVIGFIVVALFMPILNMTSAMH